MKVLLSIKPEYAEKIFNGEKKYEFRRAIFKNPGITHVVVYASSPVKKVIGEFEIERIFYDELDNLWEITQTEAGISEEYFFEYFSDMEKGYAIQIGRIQEYSKPQSLEDEYGLSPPQSFAYLSKA